MSYKLFINMSKKIIDIIQEELRKILLTPENEKREKIRTPVPQLKARLGWTDENSKVIYEIDYQRGYISREFITGNDDQGEVEWGKSYFDNRGGEVLIDQEMERKFNNAVKRIKKAAIEIEEI